MKVRNISSWVLMVAAICFASAVFGQHAEITGKFSHCSTKKVSLMQNAEVTKLLAEAIIDSSGAFTMKAEVKKTDIFKLQFDDGTYLATILQPGDKVHFEADMADLIKSLKVTGSVQTSLIYESSNKLGQYKAKLDSLNNLYVQMVQKGMNDSIRQVLTQQYMAIDTMQKKYLIDLVEKHNDKLSCLYVIDQLPIDNYFSTYEKLDAGLFAKYPDNSFVINFHKRVEGAKKLAIGSLAPEIALPDPEGNIVKLSSLRGKVVLIDFWASWCSPCRKENPNVVRMYKAYNPKGFEVFSVSLDKAKDAWVKAIKDDGLTWTHVSDLKFWQCEAALLYNVSAVPYTVLLDREGKIVAKGLRGADLETRISELLEK